ncbi:MAG: phosphopentomutase, partial [Proteobacteria bacterium]|nr:phosphopentomutase [Pseudomonadota bacterium]
MSRAFILVIDSLGIGAAHDADQYGDTGADTLGHIAEACRGIRGQDLRLPNLVRLGLGRAARLSSGKTPPGLEDDGDISAAYGCANQRSSGKDTPSGHWEMAGLPVLFDWGFFPKTEPCFPKEITDKLVGLCALPGILGNRHASGTQIIEELGEERIRTGKPICYTSADSVFQIAAHETHFGLERLYDVCRVAEEILKPLNIGRVIARPFLGDAAASFKRTAKRRDLTVPPHGPTLLDRVFEGGGEVVSIGKIADIFSHRSISRSVKAGDTGGLFEATLNEAKNARDGALVFVNFVDFDQLSGHRRNVAGYAA